MKNKAKCRLCNSIIESFHQYDYVECKCGHISVSEGEKMSCGAIDFSNFVRVDDDGNEIVVREVKEGSPNGLNQIGVEEMIEELGRFATSLEELPEGAKSNPINHYDFASFMLLLAAILKKLHKQ